MPRMKYVHRQRLRRLLYGFFSIVCGLVIFILIRAFSTPPVNTQNTLYVYWMSMDVELEADMDLNFDDIDNIVTIQMKTSSHRTIARRAFQDGHSIVLVLKDECQVSPALFSLWEKMIITAPKDWKTLQLWSNNNIIQRHVENLQDPWIKWFPEHTGDSAYFMNRKGMKHIMANPTHIFESDHSYTSTRFFVKVQQLFELATFIPKWPVLDTSTLIILSTVIEDVLQFQNELDDWQNDVASVQADWHLTIVVRSPDMEQYVQQHWPQWPNLQLHIVVFQGQYNKFTFVKRSIPVMDHYRHVIVKDSDISLSGVPWRTLVLASKNSVITGILRQVDGSIDTRQWFHFQDGHKWKTEFKDMFRLVTPQSVPFLEQFFVMLDGAFAKWFFHRILTDAFLFNEDKTPVRSNWGPDTIWCGAASEWAPDKTPCLLVPVVAKHRDTRQVTLWNSTAHRRYINMRQVHRYREAFPQWLFYDRSDVTHELKSV